MFISIRVATGLALLASVVVLIGTGAARYVTGEDPLENMLKSFHQSSEQDFIDLEGFGVDRTYNVKGYVRPASPPELAGTQRGTLEDIHAGSMQLFLDRSPAEPGTEAQPLVINHLFRDKLASGDHGFEVVAAELVSLLKHDEPRVYDIDELTIENLDDVPTRPLDAFERASLARVQAGERIVYEETAGDIRMLGELRAIRQCQDCHSVEQGFLLGAFSYRLRPGK